MNSRESAAQAIARFFSGDGRLLFVRGTHHFQKHPLVFQVLLGLAKQPLRILFRSNSASHSVEFLAQALGVEGRLQSRKSYRLEGGHIVHVDSRNRASWASTPHEIDVAVVYPADSWDRKTGDECYADLLHRGARKIAFVSWTDTQDFSWIDALDPLHVTFDAEEENPAYHGRVTACIAEAGARTRLTRKVPSYAAHVPDALLVRRYCDSCRETRWARLTKPHPGMRALRDAHDSTIESFCLKCDSRATDSYNWYE